MRSYRRFNVLGTVIKALNMAESQNGGMVADFRHLVCPERSKSLMERACTDVSVFIHEMFSDSEGAEMRRRKGRQRCESASVCVTVELIPVMVTIMICAFDRFLSV